MTENNFTFLIVCLCYSGIWSPPFFFLMGPFFILCLDILVLLMAPCRKLDSGFIERRILVTEFIKMHPFLVCFLSPSRASKSPNLQVSLHAVGPDGRQHLYTPGSSHSSHITLHISCLSLFKTLVFPMPNSVCGHWSFTTWLLNVFSNRLLLSPLLMFIYVWCVPCPLRLPAITTRRIDGDRMMLYALPHMYLRIRLHF